MLDRNEILRYLGASKNSQELYPLIERGEKEMIAAAAPKHIYQKFPITVSGHSVSIGTAVWDSESLACHLKGCEEAFLFALTLGAGVDMIIKRFTVTDLPFVPVLQACAAAYTEACADKAQLELKKDAEIHGLFLRPRYSPGYGDFSLRHQRFFFDALEITKKIGVSLTKDFCMVPFKSITAVIGLSPDPSLCHVGKCMDCSEKCCPFRKERNHG